MTGRGAWRIAGLLPAAALWCGFAVAPFLVVLSTALLNIDSATRTLETLSRFGPLLRNTLALSACVTGVCVAASIAIAEWTRSWPRLGKYVLVAVLLGPKLVHILAGAAGLRWLFAAIPLPTFVYPGFLAALIAEVWFLLPYPAAMLFAAASGIDNDLVLAARGLGATPWQAFRRVTLPILWPAVRHATVLVSVLSLGALIGPAMLGQPENATVSVDTVQAAFEQHDPYRAAVGCLILLLLASGVAGFGIRLSNVIPVSRQPASVDSRVATRWTVLRAAGLASVAAAAWSPIAVAAGMSFSPRRFAPGPLDGVSLAGYSQLFGDRVWMEAIENSVLTSSLSTGIAALTGTAAAMSLRDSSSRMRIAAIVVLLSPIAAPGLSLAWGQLAVRSWLELAPGPVYSACALATIQQGIVVVTMLPALQATRELETVARGLGASLFQAWRRVTVPLVTPHWIAAGALAAVLSLNDLPVSLMLGSPEFSTLPRLIWQQLRFAGSPTALAAAMALAAITGALALVAAKARRSAFRMSTREPVTNSIR